MSAPLFPDLIVNGETVPRRVIAAEAQNHPAPRNKPGLAWRRAADALAVRTLLLQEARRRGLEPDPQEVGTGRFETAEEALIRALLEEAVPAAAPAPDAVEAEWARDPARFRAPPLWEVSHILCAADGQDSEAGRRARARAEAVLARALENPDGFARLAQRESDCSSKASGGSLGQVGPGDIVPEIEAVVRTLREGEVAAAPVATQYGWHVVRLDAAAEGRVLPFETVRRKIADAMEKAAWTRAAQAFVGELVRNASISGADLRPG